jgi:predicted  nucleic acid-binding Zn-ribbon protein
MNHKSKIEDMLLEMIQPKLNEIEERFSRGEGLTGEDVNTLLLKSQFNHINHLDLRLDEVVADVASLKTDFKQLENRFEGLENKFEVLETKFDGLENKFIGLESRLETKFNALESRLDTKFDALESRIDAKIDSLIAQFNEFKMELRLEIQVAIHKSMKWSIGLLAFIITFLKALEMLLAK